MADVIFVKTRTEYPPYAECEQILIVRIISAFDVKWEVEFFREGKETIYQSFINDPIKPKAIEDHYIEQGYELTIEPGNMAHILKRPENG